MATSSTSDSLGGTPQASEFGAAMRDMRLAHNADLATVAANLRIRQVYLQAIEDGRFDDLPGPTYASGFVRAYAEYLGLDLGEVMRRYREVTRDAGTQAPLVAPAPVSEGRMPTGFILLVAGVLAAIAYGSWYYLTLHGRDAGEIVASLPQRIADMVGLDTSTEQPAAPAPATTLPPPVEAATESIPDVREPTKPLPSVAPPMTAPGMRAAPSTPPSPQEEIAAAPAQPSAPEAAPVQEMPVEAASAPDTAPAAGGNATSSPSTMEQAAPIESSEAASEPAVSVSPLPPEPVPEPQNASDVAVAPAAPAVAPSAPPPAESSRIVLRATAISWVELRDAEGKRVFSRLLKKGETYNVPPQPGITLATGNAGALDILVDGEAIDPIGPLGAVRRDVLLEPDALRRRSGSGR